jgi:hypothetical protein
MKPSEQLPSQLSRQIRYILTEIDDTLTVKNLPFDTCFYKSQQWTALKTV